MTTFAGIVLAAGVGRRMGGTKALIEIDGTTLVEHHVARLADVECKQVVVVVRHGVAEIIARLLRRFPAVRVESVATSSQAESLAAGLRVLDAGSRTQDEVIIVTPVDMLPARAETYRALLACLHGSTSAVTPLYAGHGGHPVIVRRAVLAPYESTVPGELPSLREVLRCAMESRRRVEVDDPRVLGDLDTPSDLGALCSRR
jgi:nicotine blue oxidoreductase